jgi:N-acetylneuraminic acid mutarotase
MFSPKKTASTIILMLFLSFPVTSFLIFPAKTAEDSWTTLEHMPTIRNGLGVAVVDGKIYAIGGYNGTALNTNEMYDPATSTWTTKEPMPTARYGFGIAVVDDKIYVIGGNTCYDSWTTSNEVYDPVTDTWETKTSIPVAGMAMSANVVNGEIYLISGLEMYYLPWYNLDENQVYDPKTDLWATKTPIPNPVFDYASAVVDDKIYIIGGRDIASDPDEQNFTQIYEPETDTWNSGKSVPIAINGQAAVATLGVFAPKRIHLLKSSLHYVYDPENDSWTQETPMLTSRSGTGVAVVNDEIYVIGGYDGENYRNENEKYTPQGYIPEFSSWIILPLLLTATLIAVLFKKRLATTVSNS